MNKMARYSLASPGPLKRVWPVLVLGWLLAPLTGWPPAGLNWAAWRPDWPLILTIWLSFRTESPVAFLGAFLLGLGFGYLTIAPPGLFSLKLLVGVLILRLIAYKLDVRGAFLVLITLLLSLLLNLVLEPWLLELGGLTLPTVLAAPLVARTALVTALAVIPSLAILDRFFRPKTT